LLCVSQALGRVRALLFGSTGRGRADRTISAPLSSTGSGFGPWIMGARPTPEMWGAILAGARRRRAPQLWPPAELPILAGDTSTSALVRFYVLAPEEHRHGFVSGKLSGASR
jgi:hypothetical protein